MRLIKRNLEEQFKELPVFEKRKDGDLPGQCRTAQPVHGGDVFALDRSAGYPCRSRVGGQ